MPIKYIPYFPNTVEGQAILNNITRTRRLISYRENDKVFEKIKRGMPFYEVEIKEEVLRKDAETQREKTLFKTSEVSENSEVSSLFENLIIHGECISACAYLKDKGIKVDLVYIDPPFASGADYAKKVYIRRNPKLAEKIKKAEQEMDNEELRAFEEKMYGDIWKKEDYLNWMYENLLAIKSIMSETASIYVHLDWHIGHYVKILLDEVFGEDNFVNEIVWRKLTAAKSQSDFFSNVKDTIFIFKKDEKVIFNPIYIKSDEDKKNYPYTEKGTGRKYGSFDFAQTGSGPVRQFGDNFLTPPAGKHWIWSQDKIDEGMNNGTIFFTKNGVPRVKRYLDEKEGNYLGDLWIDDEVKPLSANTSERTDYSTQKPEALLERIIKASSNEGMIVADFFGGSGVTAKVANDLGRHFIHCDVGINSIQITRDRLMEAGAEFKILEIRDGVSLFRNPVQTMEKLAKLIPGLQQKIEGISKFWFGAIQSSKDGLIPVYVPNLLDSKEKVLDIPQINKVINQELQLLEVDAKKVIVYYIDVEDYQEIEKFIRDNNMTEIKVELKDLKNILDDVVIEDIVEYELKEKDKVYEIEITKFISDRLLRKIDAFNEKGQLQAISNGKKFSPINISEEGLELIEMVSLDCTNKDGIWQSNSEIKIDKLGFIRINGEKTKDFWDGKIRTNKKPLRMKIRNISGDESVVDLLK